MKEFILIAVFISIAVLGCDDTTSRPFEIISQVEDSLSSGECVVEKSSSSMNEFVKKNEIVISQDCTTGNEKTGIVFDVDSVRCGKNGNIYFGLDWKEYANVSPLQFYLFSDSSATMTKDSLWILDTEFAMESNCEKLNIPNLNLSNAFCLQKFEERENKKLVLNYRNSENEKKRGVYFIYSKYGFYKAFCNVKSNACELLFSCVIQYDGTYNFSKEPSVVDVERKNVDCVIIF